MSFHTTMWMMLLVAALWSGVAADGALRSTMVAQAKCPAVVMDGASLSYVNLRYDLQTDRQINGRSYYYNSDWQKYLYYSRRSWLIDSFGDSTVIPYAYVNSTAREPQLIKSTWMIRVDNDFVGEPDVSVTCLYLCVLPDQVDGSINSLFCSSTSPIAYSDCWLPCTLGYSGTVTTTCNSSSNGVFSIDNQCSENTCASYTGCPAYGLVLITNANAVMCIFGYCTFLQCCMNARATCLGYTNCGTGTALVTNSVHTRGVGRRRGRSRASLREMA